MPSVKCRSSPLASQRTKSEDRIVLRRSTHRRGPTVENDALALRTLGVQINLDAEVASAPAPGTRRRIDVR